MLKNFIGKIQNSDEGTKKFWLVVLSGISMTIVVGFWITYMNLTITRVGDTGPKVATVQKVSDSDQPGFFAIFSAGAKTIFDEIKERLSAKRSFTIENHEKNFIANDIDEVKPTHLP